MGTCIVIGFSLCLCFRLRHSGFRQITRAKRRSHKRSRAKMETFWFLRLRRSYDSAYDSGFRFSHCISAVTTLLTIPIQSLVKPAFKCDPLDVLIRRLFVKSHQRTFQCRPSFDSHVFQNLYFLLGLFSILIYGWTTPPRPPWGQAKVAVVGRRPLWGGKGGGVMWHLF